MPLEHPVLLTGGASGVGEATAKLLLERGHRVVSLDIKPSANPDLSHHTCDLSDSASIDAVLGELEATDVSHPHIVSSPDLCRGTSRGARDAPFLRQRVESEHRYAEERQEDGQLRTFHVFRLPSSDLETPLPAHRARPVGVTQPRKARAAS